MPNKCIATLLISVLLLGLVGKSFADEPAPPPTIIIVSVAPTPTPDPLPAPTTPSPAPLAYREYIWPQSTLDAVAAIYWAECNTAEEKLAVTQLLANRAAHGAPFADTIEGCAMQGREFNRGRVSNRNRDLAEVNLNKVQTQATGEYAGITVPASAVYMRRENGVLVMLDFEMQEVWRCG